MFNSIIYAKMFNYDTLYIPLWRAWALREGESWAQLRSDLDLFWRNLMKVV